MSVHPLGADHAGRRATGGLEPAARGGARTFCDDIVTGCHCRPSLDQGAGFWEALTGSNSGGRPALRRSHQRGGARHRHARAHETIDHGESHDVDGGVVRALLAVVRVAAVRIAQRVVRDTGAQFELLVRITAGGRWRDGSLPGLGIGMLWPCVKAFGTFSPRAGDWVDFAGRSVGASAVQGFCTGPFVGREHTAPLPNK